MFVAHYAGGEAATAATAAVAATVVQTKLFLEVKCWDDRNGEFWYPRLEFASLTELSAWAVAYYAGTPEVQDAMLCAKLD